MGRCVINIEDVAKKYVCEKATEETNQGDATQRGPDEIVYEGDKVDLKPEIPKWHSIRYAPGSPECGQQQVLSGDLCELLPSSDHPDLEPLCTGFGVRFICVPVSRDTKPEAEQQMLELLP